MSYHIFLGILAGLVQIASMVPYIRDILKRNTKPNAVSWILWTLIQCIAIAAQITAGASWSVIILISMTVGTAIVSVLALTGYGYTKYGKVDAVCFVTAILAIALWQITDSPLLAIAFAVLADLFAAIPTIVKTVREPFTEHLGAWALVSFAALLSVFSTEILNLENMLFQGYIFAVTLSMTMIIFFGRRKHIAAQKEEA